MATILRIISRSELVTLRTHRKIMRELHRGVAEKHIDETLPKHFEAGAENVYHYERRGSKYQRRKMRQKGHNRPLVWSGQTLRDMRQMKQGIIANSNRSRVQYTLRWQRVANRKKASTLDPNGNTAKRVRELETILLREVDAYSNWMGNEYERKINDPNNRAKRRRMR